MTLTQRAALASMSAILTVIATYAVLRGFDVLFKSEPNPATIIWAPRIAMFWRLVVGSYAASLVAAGVFFASTGRLEATARVVAWAVPVVFAMIAVQGIFLP